MYGDGKGVRGMRVGEGEIKRVYREDMGGRLRLYWDITSTRLHSGDLGGVVFI